MTRGADDLPVSDHAVLRYLERVCGVDIERVKRQIHADTRTAVEHGARGVAVAGVVYRLQNGYVTTCFIGEPKMVRAQHAHAAKQILRKSRNVPLLDTED